MIQQMLAIWSLAPLPFLTSLNIWKFMVHILLKPGLENFEHYFTSSIVRWVRLCGSLSIVWHCLSLGLEWKLTFSSPAEFSKFAHILSAALSQHHLPRFWNSSTGIPSHPLALFVVMLSKAHLTSHSRMPMNLQNIASGRDLERNSEELDLMELIDGGHKKILRCKG